MGTWHLPSLWGMGWGVVVFLARNDQTVTALFIVVHSCLRVHGVGPWCFAQLGDVGTGVHYLVTATVGGFGGWLLGCGSGNMWVVWPLSASSTVSR